MTHFFIYSIGFLCLIALVVAIEGMVIIFNGTKVPVPVTTRQTQTIGSGSALNYVVMGDSTAVSQGSQYTDGFAWASAKLLAKTHTVHLTNVAVSGARAHGVQTQQLPRALMLKPDIVLLAAGANDTTHLTSLTALARSLQQIVDDLKKANPRVQIIVTGSPAVDAVPRFAIGTKLLLRVRTHQVNAVFAKLIASNDLILAPIAQKTRAAFLADPTLTASDNFHPNARGYGLWIPVINQAVLTALQKI